MSTIWGSYYSSFTNLKQNFVIYGIMDVERQHESQQMVQRKEFIYENKKYPQYTKADTILF